jgi:hypothetical protein
VAVTFVMALRVLITVAVTFVMALRVTDYSGRNICYGSQGY